MTGGAFSDGPTGSSVRLGGRISFFFFFFLFDFYTRLHTFRRRRFIILNQNFVPQNGRKNKQTKENKSKSTMSTPLKEGRPASRERIVSDVSISLKLFLLVKEEDEREEKNQWLCA